MNTYEITLDIKHLARLPQGTYAPYAKLTVQCANMQTARAIARTYGLTVKDVRKIV